jgi:hypothetical protein
MTGDVFEKDPSQGRAEFSDDAGNIGPEVPFIVGPAALSCHAERLAGVSGKEGVEGPGEGLGVKCGEVIPDWGGGEVSGALAGKDDGSGAFLPLDIATGVESGFGKTEAHIQACAA